MDKAELKKELKKSNKELDKYLNEIGLNIESLKEINEDEDKFSISLLSASVIDLRNEVRDLKRKTVNDFEFVIREVLNKKVLELQQNIVSQTEFMFNSIKDDINVSKEEISEEITDFKKKTLDRINRLDEEFLKTNHYLNTLRNEINLINNKILDLSRALKCYKDEYKEAIENIKSEISREKNNVKKTISGILNDIYKTGKDLKILDSKLEHDLSRLSNKASKIASSAMTKKEEEQANISERIIDITAKIRNLEGLK